MFSQSIFATNKNALIELFETVSRFPDLMMIRCGDYTVDAHSIIGVFSLDISKPMELISEQQPDDRFMQAIAKFVPAKAAV